MKKWRGFLLYLSCFFVLSAVIYRLALCEPVSPGEEGYAAFRAMSACLAALVAGTAVGAAAGLEYMARKYYKLKKEMEKENKSGSDE